MKQSTAAARLLLGVLLLVVILSSIPPVRADAPIVIGNPDASRTVTWTFGSPENLTLQSVELTGGRAVLPWTNRSVEWSSPDQLVANGSFDPAVTEGANGLELLADASNHVSDGSFTTAVNWTFSNGTTGQVIAEPEASAGDALLGYNAPATEFTWENFDQLSHWNWTSPPNTFGGISPDSVHKVEGVGSMNMSLEIMDGASWVSAVHSGTVDWSASDRLVVWINATDVDAPLTFNITATVGGGTRTTSSVSLIRGWQEVVVNITSLGSFEERRALQNLGFRINGHNVSITQVYFDDARIGTAKKLDEAASVLQSVLKPYTTAATPGSAYLSFDWSLANASGVVQAEPIVNLTGPSGTFAASLTGSLGEWRSFGADVSATTAGVGSYTVSFRFRMVVDNTSESHANVRIDNVSLVWPNRRNGSYQSNPIDLAAASEFLRVKWSASIPSSTSVRVSLRSGNGTDTTDASWGPWRAWVSSGDYLPGVAGADHFQIRADLNTTNASRSPSLQSFTLDTRHRVSAGTVVSDLFAASPDFLMWRSFNASLSAGTATTIDFSVGNGSYWAPVPPSGSVSAVRGPIFRWRALLRTSDGLRTPILSGVQVTYEFQGPVDHVRLSPSGPLDGVVGDRIQFQATVMDSGDHPIKNVSVAWSTTDPTHDIRDGTYTAGTPGTWNVTVTVVDLGISATARVTVASAPWSIQAILFPYGLIAAIAVAGSLYGTYELWLRRAFAIDDVFLISRDGRLMLHNTRRMRADRDEDILSGMLTAIRTFARDFDREENGDLRRFVLGGKTTLIERGIHAYLAAVYTGRVPRWAEGDLRRFMRDLEVTFGEAFRKWSGSPEDLQGLKEFTERFVSRVRYRGARTNGGLGV